MEELVYLLSHLVFLTRARKDMGQPPWMNKSKERYSIDFGGLAVITSSVLDP